MTTIRMARRLVQVAGCAALALGLASSAASTAVAAPARSCCTLPHQSLAVSWGVNGDGQLGNGAGSGSALYGSVANLGSVTQVAAGWDHALALASDGTVWTWGAGYWGQLGNGSTAESPVPEQVPNLTGVIQVAAGDAFSLALTSDGTVWAWGADAQGELGNNSTTNSDMPVQVPGLTGITQISAGLEFGLALRSDGTVWAWGLNTSGELGNGTTAERSTVPVQVTGLSQVTQIAAGGNFAIAARTQGFITTLTTVWTWGDNQYGELGDGTQVTRNTPEQVSGISVPSVRQIIAGENFSMVLGSDGSVWAWGADANGELGNAATSTLQTRPVETVGMASGITDIAAGINHVLALRSDGTVLAWGDNTQGEIGDGIASGNHTLPIEVTGLTNVTQVLGRQPVQPGRAHRLQDPSARLTRGGGQAPARRCFLIPDRSVRREIPDSKCPESLVGWPPEVSVMPTRVVLERGPKAKKFVAYAIDWPGWSRGAKTADEAVKTFAAYQDRYRPIAVRAGLEKEFDEAEALEIAEDRVGTGSVDFWGISFSPSSFEQEPMDAAELERKITVLQACWDYFDDVAARVSPQMRRGPRGGGRDRDTIIRHTVRVESEDFAKKVGLAIPERGALEPGALEPYRADYVNAMRAYQRGEFKRPMRSWTLAFLVRHSAFHTMDHAWEMEDKDLSGEGGEAGDRAAS